jgi:hypothetical protein
MALTKLQFQPGINREVTNYTNEGRWYDCDKVRFRRGFPEKLGGWQRISTNTFEGTCRALTEWSSLGGVDVFGVGTNLKYYLARGGEYLDITPLRLTTAPGAVTFTATNGSAILTVNHTAHGAKEGDFVVFSGATSLGGNVGASLLNTEHRVLEVLTINSYTIELIVTASAGDSGNGGAAVVGEYLLSPGPAVQEPLTGWGAGFWGGGPWGVGLSDVEPMRIWNHSNYGQDLIYGPRGGPLYYWTYDFNATNRGVLISGNDAPEAHLCMLVSDVSRFVIAFGCNELGSPQLDPMLVRWSDQEQYANWTPAITNQAGGIRLSAGSTIVTAHQNRQEILIWTDAALYSMQYQGPPYVWGMQLMGENISIAGPNAVTTASGVAYWMGVDKFYMYDGRVQSLPSDVKRYVFNNINAEQLDQVYAGTNESYNEIWWFYPSAGSMTNDRYVVFNYLENVWYYGTMQRTAWLDSTLDGNPVAACDGRLVRHEFGNDDATTGTPQPIHAFIASSAVDIGDGDRYAFIRRVLPDVTFTGSTNGAPALTFQLQPMRNSGSGFTDPASVGGNDALPAVRTATGVVEQFTEQLNLRVRGRQVAIRVSSDTLGTMWQLGTPRADIQPDGYNG